MLLLLVLGLAVHGVLFYSVFSINFISPVVRGLSPVQGLSPLARRLVFFSCDGLRAERLYSNAHRLPFFRSVIESQGACGICHTRVPTLSRPGNVALLAGFYEHLCAHKSCWKNNYVKFDSVFNRSRYTWAWGHSYVVSIFAEGSTGDRVYTKMYSSDDDFADSNPLKLDTWVFDHVEEFFNHSNWNNSLKTNLSEDKIVFFLHLLGMDVLGHDKMPHSDEYMQGLESLDRGVARIVDIVEKYYQRDGKTAYMFACDHGMTDSGCHGTALRHETEIPYLAWGSGFRKAIHLDAEKVSNLKETSDYGLHHVHSVDINQTDVAPLISTVIGIPIPVNSRGVLPENILDADSKYKSTAVFANALQILQQYQKLQQDKEDTRFSLFYWPYRDLTAEITKGKVTEIKDLMTKKQFDEARGKSHDLIRLLLEGMRYYQRYDRHSISAAVVLSFTGWMLYIISMLLQRDKHTNYSNTSENLSFSAYSVITVGLVSLAIFLLYRFISSNQPYVTPKLLDF